MTRKIAFYIFVLVYGLSLVALILSIPAKADERYDTLPYARANVPLPRERPHDLVSKVAAKHGVPTHLVRGVIKVESGGNCRARNRSGAAGIMQVLPPTARSVGVHGNLLDCSTGLEAGVRYLKLALARGGHGCAGVSLYERGIGARPVCTAYGRKVMRMAGI